MFSKEELASLIRDVPNFPKAGVNFKDISPLLEKRGAIASITEHIVNELKDLDFDAIACIESRGFIFATPLAAKLNKSLYLIRKKGKLPPPKNQVSYQLEYGTDSLEMRSCSGKILLVDDVLATGGTLRASAELVEKGGGSVAGLFAVIDLRFLNNFEWNNLKARSLFQVT